MPYCPHGFVYDECMCGAYNGVSIVLHLVNGCCEQKTSMAMHTLLKDSLEGGLEIVIVIKVHRCVIKVFLFCLP